MSKKLYKGIVTDLSNADYHANRTHKSSSVLKQAVKDAKAYHAKYVLGQEEIIPPALQTAFDFGTYVHAMILEPHLIEEEFAIYTGVKRQGKIWDQFKWENKDKIIITNSQLSLADKMYMKFCQSVTELDGKEYFGPDLYEGGVAEQSFFTELDGLKVKARADYRVKEGDTWIIRDVKTTSSDVSTPELCLEVAMSLGYHISAALYIDIMEKVTGEPHRFEFTFLCKRNGNKTFFYKASKEFIEKGREEYKKAIKLIKGWEDTGVYFTNEMQEI